MLPLIEAVEAWEAVDCHTAMVSTQQRFEVRAEACEKRRISAASTVCSEAVDKHLEAIPRDGSEEAETDAGSSLCLSEDEHESEKDSEGLLAPAHFGPPPGLHPSLSFLTSSAECKPEATGNLRESLRAKGHGILSKMPTDMMPMQMPQRKGAQPRPTQQKKKIVQQVPMDFIPCGFVIAQEPSPRAMKVPVPHAALAASRLHPDLPAKKKPVFAAELGLDTELLRCEPHAMCPVAIALDQLLAAY